MPQLQPVVLTDRKATPVSHNFIPRGIDNGGTASVVESSGVPIGDSILTITPTLTRTGRTKVAINLRVPIVATETVNGISSPKVVRSSNVNMAFYFDATSSTAERNDVVGMIASALGTSKTLINDTLVNLESVY